MDNCTIGIPRLAKMKPDKEEKLPDTTSHDHTRAVEQVRYWNQGITSANAPTRIITKIRNDIIITARVLE